MGLVGDMYCFSNTLRMTLLVVNCDYQTTGNEVDGQTDIRQSDLYECGFADLRQYYL